jgi:hypothetical protein
VSASGSCKRRVVRVTASSVLGDQFAGLLDPSSLRPIDSPGCARICSTSVPTVSQDAPQRGFMAETLETKEVL